MQYQYDTLGRIYRTIDFKGQITELLYDSRGRLQTKNLYAVGAPTPTQSISYTYDGLSRLYQVTDPHGLTQYGYDLDNNISQISSPEGTINYQHDTATDRLTETTTNNSDIVYGYDELGRLNKVTVNKQNGVVLGIPDVTQYVFDDVGNLHTATLPNGIVVTYGYDPLNRLTSITNKMGSTVLSSYSYILNADGLRTTDTELELQADGTTSTVTKVWGYDNLQRLTGETLTSSISGNSYTDSYSYDLAGNRLSKTHVANGQTQTTSDVFNANDQLTSEAGSGVSSYGITYGYDDNGSLTSVTRTGSGAETDSYTYDLQNRLASATVNRTESGQSVAITANYTFNQDGNLVSRSTSTSIGGGTPTTDNTIYLIDSFNPTGLPQALEELPSIGATPKVSYAFGYQVIEQRTASGARYFLADGQNSTRLLTDSSGNITDRYDFDAYGVPLNFTPGVLSSLLPTTNMLYGGQKFDPNLLFYHFGARYYDPLRGRFTSMDPTMGQNLDPQSLHKYLYGDGDPSNRSDPTGLASTFFANLGTAVHQEIYDLYRITHIGGSYRLGQAIPTIVGRLFPDIVDWTNPLAKQIGEIKPLSPYGLATGYVQLAAYLAIANGTQTWYNGTFFSPLGAWMLGGWIPSLWVVPIVPLNPTGFPGWIAFTLFNAAGVIFYKAFNVRLLQVSLAYVFALALAFRIEELLEQYRPTVPGRLTPDFEFDTLSFQLDALLVLVYGIVWSIGASRTVNTEQTAEIQSDLAEAEGINVLAPVT